MKAAEEGFCDIIRLLLERKADLELTNSKGRTALSLAAAPSGGRKASIAALRLLLESGANVTTEDDSGRTARQRAEKEKRIDALEVFQEYERYDS